MQPSIDLNFVKQLKQITPKLSMSWDVDLERWVIYYTNDEGATFKIHEIKNSDGSYRHPDNRVLEMLRRCDMSTKIDDPKYIFSEQLRKSKEYKQQQIEKHKEQAREKSREMKPKWIQALGNANRGIFNDKQLGRKTIYSFSKTSNDILKKLGKPHLTGAPLIFNP